MKTERKIMLKKGHNITSIDFQNEAASDILSIEI